MKKIDRIKLRFRLFIANVISIILFNFLRILFYRLLLGYKISFRARIKFRVVIAVDKAVLGRCIINRGCLFEGPCSLEIGDYTLIGNDLHLICPEWVLEKKFEKSKYERFCRIGKNCRTGTNIFFDVSGGITIGDGTWIAGGNSQIWTHGMGVKERCVSIGKNCYVGAGSAFAPGSAIGNNCLVGMRSVVTKKFLDDNLFIGSPPARVIEEKYDWQRHKNEN